MTDKKRLANIELLRSLAMVMIVILHFLAQSDNLIELEQSLSFPRVFGMLLENFCLAAVNVYVFISGYYGVYSTFKPGKVIALLCQFWFYALGIPLALTLLGLPTVAEAEGIYGIIKYVFPIETEHYWFATAYFMLYLLTPILNRAATGMTQRQYKILLAGLLILLCGIKSISPVVFAFDNYGYDLPWFICVYLVAAYLRQYRSKLFAKWCWFLYAGSAAGGFFIALLMWFLSQRNDSFAYYFTVPYHYNFILCLTGAIGLFYGFHKISMKEGRFAPICRRLGSLCFGVYLLHEHIDIRYRWYGFLQGIINPTQKAGAAFFLLELFFCVIVLFTAGVVIDWIRGLLFHAVSRALGRTKLARWVQSLNEAFREKNEMEGRMSE